MSTSEETGQDREKEDKRPVFSFHGLPPSKSAFNKIAFGAASPRKETPVFGQTGVLSSSAASTPKATPDSTPKVKQPPPDEAVEKKPDLNNDIVSSFRKAAEGYLNDDRFSDFTITCNGKHFKVHRCFISAHSKWFERYCSDMFEETHKQSVELNDERLEAVERMVQFFYTWDYDDNIPPTGGINFLYQNPTTPLQINAYVFALAEKYEIPTMKSLALTKFNRAAAQLEKSTEIARDMLRAVYTVFRHVFLPIEEDSLKSTILSMWIVKGHSITDKLSPSVVRKLFEDIPEFGYRVADALLRRNDAQIFLHCQACDRQWVDVLETATVGEFKCGHCGGTEAKEDVSVSMPNLSIKKYW